jgi:formate hydrogenlyase subunit 3/multisubunit Na+/H+ antiporter MnhD subunit
MIDVMSFSTAETLVAAALATSLMSTLVSVLANRSTKILPWLAFPLLALTGLASTAAAAAVLLGAEGFAVELPFGLPWLRWHLRFDPLAAFFLGIIGLVTFAVSLYGPSYVREYDRRPYSRAVLGIATGLFIAGMQLVVLADDTFAFMIAWELMSVASYILVAYEHMEARIAARHFCIC